MSQYSLLLADCLNSPSYPTKANYHFQQLKIPVFKVVHFVQTNYSIPSLLDTLKGKILTCLTESCR